MNTFDTTLNRRASRAATGWAVPAPVALLIAFVGLLAILVLWLAGAVFPPVADGWLSALGRLSGLLGGYAAILLTYCAARIPALERGVGHGKLISWHSRLGRCAFVFIAVHVAALDGSASVWTMDMARIAAYLLLLLALTSLTPVRRRLQRRLSYSVWRKVHLIGYVILVLGFFHQVVNGSDLSGNLVTTLGWSTAMAAGLSALVYRRVLQPRRSRIRAARLRS